MPEGSKALAGIGWDSTTDSFRTLVRQRLIATLERMTGGRVELGCVTSNGIAAIKVKLDTGASGLTPDDVSVSLDDQGVGRPGRSDGETLTASGFLRAQANTIEGGTTEVNKNILGEKVLGLPREPDVQAGLSWAQAQRA